MKRTQVQFDERQITALRALAREHGESVSAIVRRAVDELIARNPTASPDELWKRAATVSGAFSSAHTDISRDHDRYLAEAFDAQ